MRDIQWWEPALLVTMMYLLAAFGVFLDWVDHRPQRSKPRSCPPLHLRPPAPPPPPPKKYPPLSR